MNKRTIFIPSFIFFFLFSLFGVVAAQNAQGDLTQLSMEDLMNVEVYSASKKPERFFNTAAAIYVITPEDIRRSGSTTIPDLLRMVPGINVQRVNSHSWDISARGFNGSIFSNKLLVLIDGRAVYTPLYGGVFWDVQDVVLEDIERIEVIRGPGGTLWGANAVNGVINIITKKAKDTQGGLMTVGAGSEERIFSTLRYGGKTAKKGSEDPWFYRTYAKYLNRDESFRYSGTANDEWQTGRAGFRAEKDKMTYQGDFYKGSLGQRTTVTAYNPPYSQIDDKSSVVQGGNLMAKYEDEVSLLQAYWDLTERNLQTLYERRDTLDLEYNRHFQWTDHQEVTWGLGYRLNLEDIKDTDSIAIHPNSQADQVYSLFVQDEIKMLDDKLKLIIGSKLEHNIYTHFEVEPNVRISYAFDERSFIWAAASRAVRTPSRLETDGEVTGASAGPVFTRLIGNHDLSSEKMRSFELGYRNQIRENILLDVSLFTDHYDDLVTFIPGDVVTDHGFSVYTYPSVNGLQGDINGVELSADIKLKDWWKVKTFYTLTKSRLSTHTDITNIGLDDSLENSFPRQTAYVRSSFDLPHNFEFDVTVRYRDSFFQGAVPSDTGVDLTLTKTMKDWQVSVIGQNLLRSHHFESAGSGIGLTQMERSGYVKVTHKF